MNNVIAIIPARSGSKGVKDKKGAAKWLADAVMSSGGNVSRQKDILARLRNSI